MPPSLQNAPVMPTAASPDPVPVRRHRRPPSSAKEAEFLAVFRLYKTLAWRFQGNKTFLPRTLFRQKFPVVKNPHTVLYTAVQEGVSWSRHIKRMRCLWCRDSFFRFANISELLQHLSTCHNRYQFRHSKTIMTEIAGKVRAVDIIHMRLVDGVIRPMSTDKNLIATVEDSDFVKAKKSPRVIAPLAGEKRPAGEAQLTLNGNDQKRQRPVRACTTQVTEEPIPSPRRAGSASGSASSRRANDSKERKKSRPRSKPSSALFAYNDLKQAVREKRLYHTVVQTAITEKAAENYVDSDDEDNMQYDKEFRLRIANNEVDDFTDTLPVEKLFFNLWNQFLTCDYHAYADKMVAPGCMIFVKKFRRIIQNLNMELTVGRHMLELKRIGLIDATGVYNVMSVLGNRSESATPEEVGAKFLYAEEVKVKVERDAGKKFRTTDPGRVC